MRGEEDGPIIGGEKQKENDLYSYSSEKDRYIVSCSCTVCRINTPDYDVLYLTFIDIPETYIFMCSRKANFTAAHAYSYYVTSREPIINKHRYTV